MKIRKELELLKEELKRLEEGQPGNWLGHWAKSLKIESTKRKIKSIENKLIRKNPRQ